MQEMVWHVATAATYDLAPSPFTDHDVACHGLDIVVAAMSLDALVRVVAR
jgi:hypothetical protein